MSLPAPKPLSLSPNPSSGPAVARIAAQDAQIAQLVQQVHTLEDTNSRIHAQLDEEKARAIAALNRIREQWREERYEWREGCETLQSEHRLAHLGTRLTLQYERGLRLEDKGVLVREKIERLLREHKITLFQARVTDMVAEKAALEDELKMCREEIALRMEQHEGERLRLTAKLATSEGLASEGADELRGLTQAKEALTMEVTTLRASFDSDAKLIERLSLQVETLRTQNNAIESRNRELEHQVDKWQSLERKGEQEVMDLRKQRTHLETRMKQMEFTLQDARALENKIAKLEASLLETQEQVERGNQEVAEAQSEAAQSRKQAKKLEKQVKTLEAALETEKKRIAPDITPKRSRSKDKLQAESAIQGDTDGSSDEIIEVSKKLLPKKEKVPTSLKPEGFGKEPIEQSGSNAGAEQITKKNKGKGKAKALGRETLAEEEEEEEVQEITPPAAKNRPFHGKNEGGDNEKTISQPKLKSRETRGNAMDDLDTVDKPRSRTGKRKAHDLKEQTEAETQPRKRDKSKPPSRSGDMSAKRVEVTDAEEEDEQPQKKKKRRLITGGSSIFPNPAGFTWAPGDGGGLNIPSELSPVKEGQRIPARSGTTSLLGAWKLWK